MKHRAPSAEIVSVHDDPRSVARRQGQVATRPDEAGHRHVSSPFLVHTARLRRLLGASTTERRSGEIDDLVGVGSQVPEGSEVSVEVVVTSVMGGFTVAGSVKAPWSGECRRCLAPAGGELEVEVRELYLDCQPTGGAPGARQPRASRGGSGSDDSYEVHGEALDLEPMAHDAVLLALPLAPLCREDCLGICPECGADLNASAAREASGDDPLCRCRPPRDPRWAALDALGSEEGLSYVGPETEVIDHGSSEEEDVEGEEPEPPRG